MSGGDGIAAWATDGCVVEHNVVLLSNWSGWPRDLEFRNNLVSSEGIARHGHEISRTKDGALTNRHEH